MLLEKIAAYGEDMQVEAGHAFFELIDQKVSKPPLTSDTKLNFFPLTIVLDYGERIR